MGHSMQATKYVYAVKSPAFPGLIKIGRTQNVRERLSQLNTSCAPCPFVVVVVSPTLDCVRDEKMAHEFFSSQRREGEFFSVSETEVKDFFKTIQEKYDAELSQPPLAESESDRTRDARFRGLMCLLYGNSYRMLVKDQVDELDGGDQSLVEVINANAVSQGPVQQAYRAALAQEPVAPVLDEFCLGRKREREDRLFDMEMKEREQRLEDARLERVQKSALFDQNLVEARLEQVQKSAAFLQSLKGMADVDERTKMQLEDYTKNVLFNKLAVVVTGTSGGSGGSGGVPVDELSHEINFTDVAEEMGYKLTDAQLQRAELEMAKRYREKYKRDPPKRMKFVEGGLFL